MLGCVVQWEPSFTLVVAEEASCDNAEGMGLAANSTFDDSFSVGLLAVPEHPFLARKYRLEVAAWKDKVVAQSV